MENWTLRDNSSGAFTFPSFSISSGGYAIVTNSYDAFTDKWLGGETDPRVVPASSPFQINNSNPGDGLVLTNDDAEVVWSLGYNVDANGEGGVNAYRATWLTIDDFDTTNYGFPPQFGDAVLVNRAGTDGTGTVGYEDNNVTIDPLAYASTARFEDDDSTLDVESRSPRSSSAARCWATTRPSPSPPASRCWAWPGWPRFAVAAPERP